MTFPTSKWDVYGFCLRGFVENWPKEVQAYVICEEPQNIPIDLPDNVTVLDFDEVCGERQNSFEKRNEDKHIMNMNTVANIDRQAAKFARKAHAQLYVLENIEADYVHYIDADLYTHSPFPIEMIEKLTQNDFLVGFTPRWWRKSVSFEEELRTGKIDKGYTETGYMIWNKNHELFGEWVDLYKSMYDNDEIFQFSAWHDCVAFDYATRKLMKDKNAPVKDLGFGVRSRHPLVSGPLGKYLDHMKGNRKNVGYSKERFKVHGK